MLRNPVQIVWTTDDPAMALATYREGARIAAELSTIIRIPGKHCPQEDQAEFIAEHITNFAMRV
jgi:pimeloyl-ACP methyl ester carboxylesterase